MSSGETIEDVSVNMTNKNNSHLAVRISWSLALVYLGCLDSSGLKKGAAIELNDPPDPWAQNIGPIKWRLVAYDANVASGKPEQGVRQFLSSHGYKRLGIGGGITGTLPPGTDNSDASSFFIRKRPTDYVGVVYAFGFDGAVADGSPDVTSGTQIVEPEDTVLKSVLRQGLRLDPAKARGS